MIRSASDTVLVCMRVADVATPAKESRRRQCNWCGAAVWASPASEAAAGPGAAVICLPCCHAHLERQGKPKIISVTPDQMREVLDWYRKHRRKDDGTGTT